MGNIATCANRKNASEFPVKEVIRRARNYFCHRYRNDQRFAHSWRRSRSDRLGKPVAQACWAKGRRPAGASVAASWSTSPKRRPPWVRPWRSANAPPGGRCLSAYVGIAGSHIGTRNSKGVSPVDKRDGVTGHDMQRALEGARAVALPENQEVIHTIARCGRWTARPRSSSRWA